MNKHFYSFLLIVSALVGLTNSCSNPPQQKDDSVLQKSNDNVNTIKSNPLEPVNWEGTWVFQKESQSDTLTVEGKYKGLNLCTYTERGVQRYFVADFRGHEKEDTLELYLWSVTDGVLPYQDRIDQNKPAITLIRKNGRILTFWNQIVSEEGNGGVCFRKVSK